MWKSSGFLEKLVLMVLDKVILAGLIALIAMSVQERQAIANQREQRTLAVLDLRGDNLQQDTRQVAVWTRETAQRLRFINETSPNDFPGAKKSILKTLDLLAATLDAMQSGCAGQECQPVKSLADQLKSMSKRIRKVSFEGQQGSPDILAKEGILLQETVNSAWPDILDLSVREIERAFTESKGGLS